METKKLTINLLLLTFVIFSVVAQVFLLNKHSTMGDQLSLINKKIAKTEEENNRMSQKIASLSAMTTIAQKAQSYGLASTSEVLSLATSLPIASNLKLSL